MNHEVTVGTYGNYESIGHGRHALVFSIGGVSIYFSYDTPVAFRSPKTGLVISENVWSQTTGKHLNWICSDKSKRIPYEEFVKRLAALEVDIPKVV